MKKMILFIAFAVAVVAMRTCSTKESTTRNYAYEHYCDSIYEADADYYLDVYSESEEYCTYIEEHGEW